MTDFYTFQPVTMHRTIVTNLNKTQMGRVITLCENSAHKIRGKFGLWNVPGWTNALIHELYLTAHITSLPEVPLPVIEEFATPTDQLNKTLQYEWSTARIELEVLLGDSHGNWASLGETALKNSSGYRYRKHRLLDLITDNPGFQLEENFKLGVMLKNMGFGDIKDSDRLSITGSWTQEFIAVQQQPPYVVNNNYGSSTAPTPVAASNAVLTLTVSSGTQAFIGSDTPINISLTKAEPSKSFTATWRKDGTLTTITTTLLSDASGNVNTTFNSGTFSLLGAGKYSLEITDFNKAIISNEINAVMPNLVLSPTTAYNWANSTISVAVSNLAINTTYILGFIGLTATNVSRTQAGETTTFTFSGTVFTQPGIYKARLTKNNIVVDSVDLTILPQPTFTLTTPRANIGYYSEDTQVSFKASNLQKSTAFTYQWIKNGAIAVTASGTTDVNGEWLGSFGSTVLQNAPYGEGIYHLKLILGTAEITSNSIEIRALKYHRQPTSGQTFSTGLAIVFDVVGIPIGENYSYVLLKSGVVQGSSVTQTFGYTDTANLYHRITVNSTEVYNNYGASTAYSVRVTYNGKTLTSNTFSIQPASPPALG